LDNVFIHPKATLGRERGQVFSEWRAAMVRGDDLLVIMVT
jgi:hypothetical protein